MDVGSCIMIIYRKMTLLKLQKLSLAVNLIALSVQFFTISLTKGATFRQHP